MKIYNEIKLAQELIRFPTVKTEDKGIMKFLSRKLTAIGFKCTIIKSKGTGPKPALNLYARFGKSKPHINFLGHTDVVANLNDWKIAPFRGVIKKGYLKNFNSDWCQFALIPMMHSEDLNIQNQSLPLFLKYTKKRVDKLLVFRSIKQMFEKNLKRRD